MPNNLFTATFWEHLEDLRHALFRILAVLISGFVICFLFYSQLFSLLTSPFKPEHSTLLIKEQKTFSISNPTSQPILYQLPEGKKMWIPPGEQTITIENPTEKGRLTFFSPTEGISATLKTCFWLSIILTFPAWIYFVFQFLSPALNQKLTRYFPVFTILSYLFLLAGSSVSLFISIPIANTYLTSYNESLGQNLWGFTNYLDYTLFLMLASGLSFELALILFFLVHTKTLKTTTLTNKRRHVWIMALILGALLTPPDILTQILIALPLIILYEVCVLYSWMRAPILLPISLRGNKVMSSLQD